MYVKIWMGVDEMFMSFFMNCIVRWILSTFSFFFVEMEELNSEKIQNKNETNFVISTWTEKTKKMREKERNYEKRPIAHIRMAVRDDKQVAQWMHAKKKGKNEDCFMREFVDLLRAKYCGWWI